jgi:hypothetical protein
MRSDRADSPNEESQYFLKIHEKMMVLACGLTYATGARRTLTIDRTAIVDPSIMFSSRGVTP